MDQPSGHEVRSSQLALYAVYTHTKTANSSCIRQLWTAPPVCDTPERVQLTAILLWFRTSDTTRLLAKKCGFASTYYVLCFGSEQPIQLDCSTLRLSLAKKWGFASTYYVLCYALLWQTDCEGFSITHNFIFYPFIIFYLAFYPTYFTGL